ncbi:MAG: YaeQ family protein [Gammaproteobacteria bacterium]|nr:YaeQ family protein [Gammaproteobacteria bacterium]MBU1645724.1 YaeQ family protein [Gammaproteobacteria bacterium]MBU1971232.1 YaeQ family protein [Gammaproteobacteria bacterium]
MALKSTIFKANLNIADMDRPYYGAHSLTLARHPSETDERMMVRLLAFALFADERLEFGRGISADDEPALWLKEYSGDIRLWIEVGLPDERAMRKAAGRAAEVVVLAYGGRSVDLWWAKEGGALWRLPKLRVLALDGEQSAALAALAQRGMDLQCTIQDGHIWLTDGKDTVSIEPRWLAGKPD